MEQAKIDRLQWILDDAVARGEIDGCDDFGGAWTD